MEKNNFYEVVVIGGGISGALAGISAARQGSKVLIIEKHGYMGGSLTANGVGPMMTFHAGEKQVIKGIAEEVIQRLQEIGKSPGHVRDTTDYVHTVTPFDAEGLKYVLDQMLMESKGSILYHTNVIDVDANDGIIESVTVSNKLGVYKIKADVLIDASGDADVATMCNVPYTKGREEDNVSQPVTLNMKYTNVDRNKLIAHIKAHIGEFERLRNQPELMDTTARLSIAGFVKEFNKAKENGEINIPREDILFFETNNQGEFIINTTRILNKDATDAQSLSEAEIEGRIQAFQLDKFLRTRVAGFENAVLMYTGPSIGIRGSRQIKGIYTLTARDILDARQFEDVIAHSGYPIDIHNPDGEGTNTMHLEPNAYYQIPYRIMVTNEIKNLIVTGRCVSATFEAQAGIRTTPTVAALGQASGIAASMAAKSDKDVRNINIKQLQNNLIKNGAYLEV